MADLGFWPVRSRQPETIVIHGSFAPNGSSAVSSASNKGKGWSVARTGAGEFTITFGAAYPDLQSFQTTLQLATPDDKFLVAGTYSSTAKTIKVTVWDVSGAAATDVAADANNRIHFVACFRNTTGA